MSVTVSIPASFREYTGGERSLSAEPGTLQQVVEEILDAHPALRDHLVDPSGGLHRHVNLYVGDEDVRYLDGLDTDVPDGSDVTLIPAVAGGSDATRLHVDQASAPTVAVNSQH